jgi:hypothetical protein
MTLEEQRKKVTELCDLKDWYYEQAKKYSDWRLPIPDRIYEAIKDINKQLEPISNINTLRDGDFAKFARGDFGFI